MATFMFWFRENEQYKKSIVMERRTFFHRLLFKYHENSAFGRVMSNNYVLPKVCRVTIEKSILRSVTIIEQVKM